MPETIVSKTINVDVPSAEIPQMVPGKPAVGIQNDSDHHGDNMNHDNMNEYESTLYVCRIVYFHYKIRLLRKYIQLLIRI